MHGPSKATETKKKYMNLHRSIDDICSLTIVVNKCINGYWIIIDSYPILNLYISHSYHYYI